MVFRGRLVGGFPPSPVLILSPIKAPKEQQARRKEKCHVLAPDTNKRDPTEIRNPIPIPLLPTTI
jgi:hypothetical protein